jgi:hypothetical protein
MCYDELIVVDLRRQEDLDADLSDRMLFVDAVERELGEVDDRVAHAVHQVVVVDLVVTAGPIVPASARSLA